MGIFSKKKKNRQYLSEEAQDDVDPEYNKRKDPYLVIGDAPPRPRFAGQGLTPDTVYQFQRSESEREDVDQSKSERTGEISTRERAFMPHPIPFLSNRKRRSLVQDQGHPLGFPVCLARVNNQHGSMLPC
jgi:hypothetical protein